MALQSHLKFLLLFAGTFGVCQEINEREVSEPAKTFDTTPIQDENFVKEDQSEYLPRLSVGGFYHNHDHLFGELDVFLPFIQTDDFLLFGNLRGLDFKGSQGEINLGLGVRVLCQHWLFGIYSYYDRKRSEHRKLFNQITAGIEAKTRRFTFDANAYIPFGKTRIREKEFDKVELRDGDNNFKNIWYVRGQEVALWGLDGEIGYNFWKWFSLFAGGFYFDRKGVPSLAGPMGRIEANVDTYKTKNIFYF
ncbi:MAG: Invasin [Chlamydiae bacterium]|nr:Invasin [Chlamydiota bacterium]